MDITEVSISLSEIFAPVFGVVAAALGYILKEKRDKIKNLQNQLSDRKYNVYHDIFSFFFDVLKSQKKLSTATEEDLVTRLINIKKDLVIYAPDNIIRKLIEWDVIRTTYPNDPRHLSKFLELFILIRKDMGHHKTSIIPEDILRFIMANEEEFRASQPLIFRQ